MPTSDEPADDALPADDTLLAELGLALERADPVPDEVLAAARLALGFRDLDAGLARLVEGHDGALPGLASAATTRRGGSASEPELRTFAGGGVTIELQIIRRGENVEILGQLELAEDLDVTVEDADGVHPVEVDELGRFMITGLRPGRARMRCLALGGGYVATEWMIV